MKRWAMWIESCPKMARASEPAVKSTNVQIGAPTAKLGARLNHLRQPQLWTLSRVARHEKRAQSGPKSDGNRTPCEVQSLFDADHAGRERAELRSAREPHRPKPAHGTV